jgi:hypothetical protein
MTADRAHRLAVAFYLRVSTLDREAWLTTVAEILRREFSAIAGREHAKNSADAE